jgi:hypothetical protein
MLVVTAIAFRESTAHAGDVAKVCGLTGTWSERAAACGQLLGSEATLGSWTVETVTPAGRKIWLDSHARRLWVEPSPDEFYHDEAVAACDHILKDFGVSDAYPVPFKLASPEQIHEAIVDGMGKPIWLAFWQFWTSADSVLPGRVVYYDSSADSFAAVQPERFLRYFNKRRVLCTAEAN